MYSTSRYRCCKDHCIDVQYSKYRCCKGSMYRCTVTAGTGAARDHSIVVQYSRYRCCKDHCIDVHYSRVQVLQGINV